MQTKRKTQQQQKIKQQRRDDDWEHIFTIYMKFNMREHLLSQSNLMFVCVCVCDLKKKKEMHIYKTLIVFV